MKFEANHSIFQLEEVAVSIDVAFSPGSLPSTVVVGACSDSEGVEWGAKTTNVGGLRCIVSLVGLITDAFEIGDRSCCFTVVLLRSELVVFSNSSTA